MTIIEILQEVAEAEELPFNHGIRSDANLKIGPYPRLYLNPLVALDEFDQTNQLKSSYVILIDLHDQVKGGLDYTEEDLTELMTTLEEKIKRVEVRLKKRPEVKEVINIRREPIYGALADILFGWALQATVVFKTPFKLC